MTGNIYVLLSLAEAIVSFLPAVGPVAARRSRAIARRTSFYRSALIGRVTASVLGTRSGRMRIDAAGPNAACAGEELAP